MKAFLYILNTLADWEIGYIIAELNSGRFFNKTKTPVKLVKIGNTVKPIKTMGGITITPNESINNIIFNKSDILILPGADTWLGDNNKNIMNPETLEAWYQLNKTRKAKHFHTLMNL